MTREGAHPLHALVVDERPERGARVHAAAQLQLAHALGHGIHKRVVHAILRQGQFGVAHLLMGQVTSTLRMAGPACVVHDCFSTRAFFIRPSLHPALPDQYAIGTQVVC